ncbi:MAG: LemA family protein [Nitrospirae bacterium]|nr:LemA family protein [Nitrospirota bacterium]
MKKFTVIAVLILVIAGASAFGFFSVYNKFVKFDEGIKSSWTQMENYLHLISKLVPRYSGIINSYSVKDERGIIKAVEDARIRLIWAKTGEEKIAAANDLLNALASLHGIVELYPEIRKNPSFIKLSEEFTIVENSLNNEKKDYNGMVKKYNQKKRQVPYNIIAFISGFKDFPYFTSLDAGRIDPKKGLEERLTK